MSGANEGTPPAVYTVAALAEHWGCSTSFIYEQIACGALPAWKLGGKLYRIGAAAVEEYEARAVVAVPEAPAGRDSGTPRPVLPKGFAKGSRWAPNRGGT
jgi:excisionase family DNA binding protein